MTTLYRYMSKEVLTDSIMSSSSLGRLQFAQDTLCMICFLEDDRLEVKDSMQLFHFTAEWNKRESTAYGPETSHLRYVTTTVMASVSHTHIHPFYRFLFLYFEPFAAFGGAVLNVITPASYLTSLAPHATYSASNYPVHVQLAGHLVLFAWIQAVLLRATASVQLWKIVLFGILLCDALHLYSDYAALGLQVFFDPSAWRKEEWLTFAMTYGPMSARALFCAGVGVGEEGKEKIS
ncbi:MAG: hypothetical protein Q9191_003758 [Dirinaria sp. TL-2023a]